MAKKKAETQKAAAAVAEPAAEPQANEAERMDEDTKSAKRLSDLAGTGGAQFEGDLVTLEAIAGKEVLVMDYKTLPSSFRQGGTYVCMQIKLPNGKLAVVNTNALVIVKGLANVLKADLQAQVIFAQVQGADKTKKPYWNMT